MNEEEIIKKQAKEAVTVAERYSIRNTEAYFKAIVDASSRLYKPQAKSVFFNEAIRQVKDRVNAHRSTCSKGPGCHTEQKYEEITFYLRQELDSLGITAAHTVHLAVPSILSVASDLTHLHPTIQAAASSLFATGHYRQALLDAYIAVDNAVREKSQLTGSGTRLMEVAFSPGNPVLKIGDSTDEQQGFLALFRGAMLAIRNPKAHSLKGTHDAQRALEWLSFASVLLRNLDEAILAHPLATPPAL